MEHKDTGGRPHSGRPTPLLGIAVATAASLAAVILPLLVTVSSRVFHLSAASAGRVEAAEMFGFAAGSALVSALLSRTTVSRLMVTSVAVVVAGNLLTLVVAPQFLLPLRLVTGIGEGMGGASNAAIVAGTSAPERYFGILLCSLFIGATVILRLDAAATAAIGPHAVYWILAGASLLTLPAALFARKSTQATQAGQRAPGGALSRTTLIAIAVGLTAIMASYAAWTTIWAYAANVGQWSGLSLQQTNVVLSYATLAGMAGAGVAIVLGPRLGNAIPLLAAGVFMAASVVVVIFRLTPSTFPAAILLWMAGIEFATPYMIGFMSEADREGRATSLCAAAQTLGMSVGPALGAIVVDSASGAVLGSLAIVLLIPSFLVMVAVAKWVRRMERGLVASHST